MVERSSLRADLETLANAKVLFGHQSVGRDLLAGLATLAAEFNVPLHILDADGAAAHDGPGLFHSNIGENGDPSSKCEVFASLLMGQRSPKYDVAMMKFCYVDLSVGGSEKGPAILDRYTRLVTQVREMRPDVTLVHITMPLRADPPGKKTYLKRLLNRSTDEDADNILRNEFNAGLRQRFSGEPVFDLATLQSTRPDGSRSFFLSVNDKPIYTLAPEYTEDGGHLNAQGQRRAAAELARSLAEALRRS